MFYNIVDELSRNLVKQCAQILLQGMLLRFIAELAKDPELRLD